MLSQFFHPLRTCLFVMGVILSLLGCSRVTNGCLRKTCRDMLLWFLTKGVMAEGSDGTTAHVFFFLPIPTVLFNARHFCLSYCSY